MASHRRALLLLFASALCLAAGKPKPEPKADDGEFTLYRGASTAVVLKARSQMAAARGLVDAAPGEAVALISDGPVAKGRAAGVTIGPGPRDVATLGNHSFLFVSGMPQSGTSLMEHLLGAAGTTSGLKTCLKATRCHSFNVEGDWMRYHPMSPMYKLKQDAVYDAASASQNTADVLALVASWSTWWDLDKPVLVQKSTHDMERLEWMVRGFRAAGAASLKYAVMLKDPVCNKHLVEIEMKLGKADPSEAFEGQVAWVRDNWLPSYERLERALLALCPGGGTGCPELAVAPYFEMLKPESCMPLMRWAAWRRPGAAAAASQPAALSEAEAAAARACARVNYTIDDDKEPVKGYVGPLVAASGGRRLGYKGSLELDEVAVNTEHYVAELASRRAQWDEEVVKFGSKDHDLAALDARTRRFGYALLPGGVEVDPMGSVLRDFFIPGVVVV